MEKRHLIGFSLSFCIGDILAGKVDIEEILFIQTGCSPSSDEKVKYLIDCYCKSYREWKADPAKARTTFYTLLHDHRIGWASSFVKNTPNLAWGNWLSTRNAIVPQAGEPAKLTVEEAAEAKDIAEEILSDCQSVYDLNDASNFDAVEESLKEYEVTKAQRDLVHELVLKKYMKAIGRCWKP